MFRKNNFIFGFSLAMMVTFAGFGALYLLNHYILAALFGKAFLAESTVMIVSLGLNIFVLNYYLKRNANQTGKGMLTFVFIWAGFIIYYYFGAQLGFRPPRPDEVLPK